MEKLKTLEHALIEQALCQLEHLDTVDTKEFGEVIDMIKDLEDAMYHHTITKAMHEQEENEEHCHDKVMYYGDRRSKMTEYHEVDPHAHIGQSPMSRKAYMEGKEKHHDKETRMKELETYSQDLMADIVDMMKDAAPEEKVMLQQKIAALATKIK